ncbi:hypothetical protein PV325_011747, partial [Microctonus aethiopoides]
CDPNIEMGDLQIVESIDIKKFAEALCDLVNCIEEVNFDSCGKGSICELLFLKQKKKFDRKKYLQYNRIWNGNHGNIKKIVRSILRARSKENTMEIYKEKNIDDKNEKSYDAVRQILDDQCDTPRRSTTPLRRRLFSEENSLNHISNV